MDSQIKLMVPNLTNIEYDLVKTVLDSGHLVDGPMTREFEKLILNYTGSKYAIACTSATTGLEMCLRTLGIGHGDEVIIPDFTHPATGLAVMAVGATPVIVDVDFKTFNTELAFLSDGVSEMTKAVIPVSWGGQPLKMIDIIEYCKSKSISVIEDAACSLGSEFEGIKTGELADFTVFSFHPRKIIGVGDGGCIVTNKNSKADFLRSYKNFGIERKNGSSQFTQYGTNQRLSGVLAAIAVGQLQRLNEILNDRIEKAQYYNYLLKNVEEISLPFQIPSSRHTFQSYCIFIKKLGIRDKLISEMREMNIEVQIGTYAIHKEPVFQKVKELEISKIQFHYLIISLHCLYITN